jgi:beta-N-acetylhexosaminidase
VISEPSSSRNGLAAQPTPLPEADAIGAAVLGSPYPLDVAVGQMFAATFNGRVITPGLRHLILDDKVGTVLLFADNFRDAADLARLDSELVRLGQEARLPAPLLITLDQEGGQVARVRDGITQLPSEMELGARGPAVVRAAIASMASGLHQLGVGLDLAPVADLRTNPADAVIEDRSFGSDPAKVGALVAAAVQGLHDGGVGATLKHFPGLGGAAGDPHSAIPTDPVSQDRWQRTQALSFAAGIAAGADAVMTTAVYVPGLDGSHTPAFFSRVVVTGLLREQLGFNGVIVCDSLSMPGVSNVYGLPSASVLAVSAGNDLVLLGEGDSRREEAALKAVESAVTEGNIPIDQVEASAQRVVQLRLRLLGPMPESARPSRTL